MLLSGVRFMQNILSRDLIRDYINFERITKPDLCRLIDQWKCALYFNGAEKGDLVAISLITVNPSHVAALFACAELGLRVILLDAPATKESLPYTKLALHGPAKFCLSDNYTVDNHRYTFPKDMRKPYGGLHSEMIHRYCEIIIHEYQVKNIAPFKIPVEVTPDTPFLVSSTSGTTKPSRPVTFTHGEVYWMAERCIDIFKFSKDNSVAHSRNLHHASAMITSLLPSLMVCEHHLTIPFSHIIVDGKVDGQREAYHKRRLELLQEGKFDRIMMPNKKILMSFLESVGKRFERTMLINMSGFAMTQEFVDLCEEYNVEFISHYGSIDTAIPLLVNHVTKDSRIVPQTLGILPDNQYSIELTNGRAKIQCSLWEEPRYMDDVLTLIDGQYILEGRIEESQTVEDLVASCKEPIDLDLFFQDTKLNMEQLRGHVQTINEGYVSHTPD